MKAAWVLVAGLIALSPSVSGAKERKFTLDVPAEGLQRLDLRSRVGEVIVLGEDTKTVEIRVTLEPDEDWFGRSEALAERLAEARLEHEVSGGVLRVSLDYDRSGIGEDDLEERWQVRMPAALATDMGLNVGRAEIRDTSGGVDAEVNVGELQIDIQKGDVAARVNVGELQIRSATSSLGAVDLESNIGEASLRIDGKDAGRASGWLGRSVTHEEGGDDDINARVNVGEVRVRIKR